MTATIKLPPQSPQLFTKQAQFIFQKQIGEGAFAKVFSCIEISTKRPFAVKVIDLTKLLPSDVENIETEIAIHSQLHSDYIVKLHGFFQEDSSVCLVTELLSRGNLFYSMHRSWPNEYEIKKIFRQVCMGMAYLHRKNIILRDLKPENLLLTDCKNVKICDFGWAAQVSDSAYCRLSAGTLTYMSPECLQNQNQDLPSDIWTLGIFLYELYHCREPFPGKSKQEMIDLLKMPKLVLKNTLKSDEVALILQLLELDFRKRPKIEQILKSPFFDSLFQMGYLDLELREKTPKTAISTNFTQKSANKTAKKVENFLDTFKNLKPVENCNIKTSEFISCREVKFVNADFASPMTTSLPPTIIVTPPQKEADQTNLTSTLQTEHLQQTHSQLKRVASVQYVLNQPRVRSAKLEQSPNLKVEQLQSPIDNPFQFTNSNLSSTPQQDTLAVGKIDEHQGTSIRHFRISGEPSLKLSQSPGNQYNDYSREDDSLYFKGSVVSDTGLDTKEPNGVFQKGCKFRQFELIIPSNSNSPKMTPIIPANQNLSPLGADDLGVHSIPTKKRVFLDSTLQVINTCTREVNEEFKVSRLLRYEDDSGLKVKRSNNSFDSLDTPKTVALGRNVPRRYTLMENRPTFDK